MSVDLNDLKVGDSVRFVNGQVAKVVDIKEKYEISLSLYFNKKVASDVGDPKTVYDRYWYYEQNGECSGCSNHIIEIMKKG